jgi:tetratricopeptide (TPR) repeat protein
VNLLESILGRRKKPIAAAAQTPSVDFSLDPDSISVVDGDGRESFILRDTWRRRVLPSAIRSSWNDPDELYSVIVGALDEGFFAEVADAAQHLYEVEGERARATCAWGIALTKAGRLEEAEKVFRQYLDHHPEDGAVLTNLAKVSAERGLGQEAEKLLWHALEVDPNQQNGLGWYLAIQRERGGREARLSALRRVAALPSSWRAQLELARLALAAKDLERAVGLYTESLSRVTRPVPTDLLMQMSGDLGQSGRLIEILQLVEPLFEPENHGLSVGNNLLKACLELGRARQARRIFEQLKAIERPDWRAQLAFWETTIAQAKGAARDSSTDSQLKADLLTAKSPVWLKPGSPLAELFTDRQKDGSVVCFLGSAATFSELSDLGHHPRESAAVRLCRALPLFLAEQLELGSSARTQTLVPWRVGPSCGYIVHAGPWTDADAATQAKQGGLKSDYVVTSHLLEGGSNVLTAELRLVRVSDARCVGSLSRSIALDNSGDAVLGLARELLKLAQSLLGVRLQPFAPAYTVPDAASIPSYLDRLERLLTARCSSLPGLPAGFLHDEREIIEQNLSQCLINSQSISMRILLAQTLIAVKRVHLSVLSEYAERVRRLQTEHPLVGAAQERVQSLVDEAFGESSPLHSSPLPHLREGAS